MLGSILLRRGDWIVGGVFFLFIISINGENGVVLTVYLALFARLFSGILGIYLVGFILERSGLLESRFIFLFSLRNSTHLPSY